MDDYISRINIHTILVCKHYESYLRLEYFFFASTVAKSIQVYNYLLFKVSYNRVAIVSSPSNRSSGKLSKTFLTSK